MNNMTVLGMMLASLSLVFPGWLIWRAFSTSRQLEQRLAQGDATLLNDDRFSIDRVTLGPPGTQLIEDVQFIPVQQIATTVQPTAVVKASMEEVAPKPPSPDGQGGGE